MGFLSWLFQKKKSKPLDPDEFKEEHWVLDPKKKDLRFPLEGEEFYLEKEGNELFGILEKEHNFSWIVNPLYQYTDFFLTFETSWVEKESYGALSFLFRYINDENFYYLSLSTKNMIRLDALFNNKPYPILPWLELPDERERGKNSPLRISLFG